MHPRSKHLFLCLALATPVACGNEPDKTYDTTPPGEPVLLLPKTGLVKDELAVVVNDSDPDSVTIAAYYLQARGLDASQLVHVSFPVNGAVMTPTDFAPIKSAVDAALDPSIQALALTWLLPYRVGCMAITSAFALGYADQYCNTSGAACAATAPVDYYGSDSLAPFTDHALRPAMMLAGTSVANVEALIDRGVAADRTFPTDRGYFVRTTDTARSVRYGSFQATVTAWNREGGVLSEYIDNAAGTGSNYIESKADVLFYFTGLTSVPSLDTLTFRPGAAADHLTSYGGVLDGTGQMSIIRWLEAGATASFGTVVEPCNYTTKFPETQVFVPAYFGGNTLLEAYWKSVSWPGEGVFVGEPLAKPWGNSEPTYSDGTLSFSTTTLEPGKTYEIGSATSEYGPFVAEVSGLSVDLPKRLDVSFPAAAGRFYKLQETAP